MQVGQILWGATVFALAWVPAGVFYLRVRTRIKRLELAVVRTVVESNPNIAGDVIDTYQRLAQVYNRDHACLSPTQALVEARRLHGLEPGES